MLFHVSKAASVFMLLACVILLQADLAKAGDDNRVRLEGRLSGRTLASGKAKFESRDGRAKLSAEVEDTTPGSTVVVIARRGSSVITLGAVPTNAFGVADLNLDTDLGHTVPTLKAGDVIEVQMNGQTLVSGRLAEK